MSDLPIDPPARPQWKLVATVQPGVFTYAPEPFTAPLPVQRDEINDVAQRLLADLNPPSWPPGDGSHAWLVRLWLLAEAYDVRHYKAELVISGLSLPTVTGPTVSSPHGPIAAIKSLIVMCHQDGSLPWRKPVERVPAPPPVWAEYRAREAQLLRELRGHYGCHPVPLQFGWAVDLVEFTASGAIRPIVRGQGPDPVAAMESMVRLAHQYRLPWKLPEAALPPPAPPAERIPAPPPPPLPLDTDVRTLAYTSPATPTELAALGGRPLRSGDPTPWEDE